MGKIIIGIHGLANKPKEGVLEGWWKKSIAEGLTKNCEIHDPDFKFKIVYWAKYLYKHPMHRDEAFSFDKLYNHEPYIEAQKGDLKTYQDSWKDTVRAGAFNIVGAAIDKLKKDFEMDHLADEVLSKFLKDLAFYYDEKRLLKNSQGQMERASDVLKNELKMTLKEAKDKEIMLIAHSMGTIIAYDALRELGRSDNDVKVSSFVTIGSPLGLPHVKHKIIEQCPYDPVVRTPSIVTESWVNFADRKDLVALDIHLRDDYKENGAGIRVQDDLVFNNYKNSEGEGNAHKSYGYLRTPELSRHVASFLGSV